MAKTFGRTLVKGNKMEKQGIVKKGVTPSESTDKKASKETVESLEKDHPTRRIADHFETLIEKYKKEKK